jgi:hypothetical protein
MGRYRFQQARGSRCRRNATEPENRTISTGSSIPCAFAAQPSVSRNTHLRDSAPLGNRHDRKIRRPTASPSCRAARFPGAQAPRTGPRTGSSSTRAATDPTGFSRGNGPGLVPGFSRALSLCRGYCIREAVQEVGGARIRVCTTDPFSTARARGLSRAINPAALANM